MKAIYKYISLAVATVFVSSMAISCTETDAEKDRGATPVIKYVRPCEASKSDSLITAASLGAKLAFIGDNLGDVQQVWFNDQKAKLNPTMVTSHTLIVDIPNVIPGEVTNSARFITSTGVEVEYPFSVTVPAPRVDAMDCEWALPGSQATVEGAYFANDPNVPLTISIGDKQAKIVSNTQNTITFIVPDGAEEAPVYVSSIYGKGKTTFNYHDTRGMLFDFDVDGITGLGCAGNGQNWHASTYVSDENSIDGTYIRLGDGSTPLNTDSWEDGKFAFEYWPGSWNTPTDYPERAGQRLYDVVDFSKYGDMALKFEMRIPEGNAWQSCGMQLIFAGTDKVSMGNAGTDIYGNIVPGANNSYFQDDNGKGESIPRAIYRPWSETAAFHTSGKWITVVVPFSEFAYNSVGGKATLPLTPESFASFMLFVWNGGVEGVECTPIICIDNIRAVKI